MSWAEDTKMRFQIAAILMAFGCPAFLIWMSSGAFRQMESNNWPSVEGVVVQTIAKPWLDSESNTKYYGRVLYHYTVNGQAYQSDLTDLGPGAKRSDPQTAQADVKQYQPGMKVQVYYDPTDPSVAIIEKGIPTIHLALLIGLSVLTVICVITSFFTIRGWLRQWNSGSDRSDGKPETA